MICFLEIHLFFPFLLVRFILNMAAPWHQGTPRANCSLTFSRLEEVAHRVSQRTYTKDGLVPINDATRYGSGHWNVVAIIHVRELHMAVDTGI